jgi:hypothetical protein
MRQVPQFRGTLGEVVWLVDAADQNIIEVDWRGQNYQRLGHTDDPIIAASAFFRTAENLL